MSTRRIALSVFTDIAEHGAYANLRLKALPDSMEERGVRFVTALVYTALDHLRHIDYILAAYVKRACKPVARDLLRLGVCELLFFGTPSHAVLSEYVNLTREIGKAPLSGFVNAVLRAVERDRDALPALPNEPVARLSVQYSFPNWLVSEWCAQYGEAFTERLLSSASTGISVRAQYPCTTKQLLAELPVSAATGALDPNCLLLERGYEFAASPAFLEGRMTVQSQSAMLVCRALGDCRGKRVLDACAAPGGKSAYIASLAENDVRITAMELHAHRKALLDKTLARLHVPAETMQHDASVPVDAFRNEFDAVLLDAPCSGLGVLADKPDVRYAKSDADVVSLAALQKRLLAVCADYVKPGGVLLYATCTISRRENEDNVLAFLAARNEFMLEPMPFVPANDGMLQLFPHVHGTDGFFLARMKRCI